MKRRFFAVALAFGVPAFACATSPDAEDDFDDLRPSPAAADASAPDAATRPRDAAADRALDASTDAVVDAPGDATDDAQADASAPADGGSDARVDAGPATWDPTALGAGLALWLDAAERVTLTANRVSAWQDRSPNQHSATQSTATARPMVEANGINGRPVVRFPRSTFLRIADAPSLQFGTGDFCVVVVARHTTPSNGFDADEQNGALYLKAQPVTFPYRGVSMFANFNRSGASSALGVQVDHNVFARTGGGGYNDGRPFVLGARRVGARLEARLNGAVAGVVQNAGNVDVSAPGQPAFLGGRSDGIQFLTGDIAEVVAHKGALADAELAKLEAYLRTKYGL
jgi:hypothetical protein